MIILFIVLGPGILDVLAGILSTRKRFGHSFLYHDGLQFDIVVCVLYTVVVCRKIKMMAIMKYTGESTPLFTIEDQSQSTYIELYIY